MELCAISALEPETEVAGAVLLERICYHRRLLASTAVSGRGVRVGGAATLAPANRSDTRAAVSLFEGSSNLSADLLVDGTMEELFERYTKVVHPVTTSAANKAASTLDAKRALLMKRYGQTRISPLRSKTPAGMPTYMKGTAASRSRTPPAGARVSKAPVAVGNNKRVEAPTGSLQKKAAPTSGQEALTPQRQAIRTHSPARDPLDDIFKRHHRAELELAGKSPNRGRQASPTFTITRDSPKQKTSALASSSPTSPRISYQRPLSVSSPTAGNSSFGSSFAFGNVQIHMGRAERVGPTNSSFTLKFPSPNTRRPSPERDTSIPTAPKPATAPIPTPAPGATPFIIKPRTKKQPQVAPLKSPAPVSRPRHTALDHDGIMAVAKRIAEMEKRLADKIAEKLAANDNFSPKPTKASPPKMTRTTPEVTSNVPLPEKQQPYEEALDHNGQPESPLEVAEDRMMASSMASTDLDELITQAHAQDAPSDLLASPIIADENRAPFHVLHQTLVNSSSSILEPISRPDDKPTNCQQLPSKPSLRATYTYRGLAHVNAKQVNRM